MSNPYSVPSVEYNDNSNADFSKEKLIEIQRQADKLYQPFKEGETITVQTRRKSYTGAFGGMVGGKLKVGVELVPTVDLSQEILDRAKPDLMMKRQQDFIMANYYIPKKEFEVRSANSQKDNNNQ